MALFDMNVTEIARIAMGSALLAVGLIDLKAARSSEPRTGWLSQLDEALFESLSEDTAVALRKATATILLVTGLGICLSAFF